MSHALADFDQDQKLDIYMVGMGSTTARRLESLGLGRPGFENIQQARMKMGYGNRLLLGQGGLAYRQPDYNDWHGRGGRGDVRRGISITMGIATCMWPMDFSARNQLGITVRNIGGMIFITIKNVLKRSCRWCSLNASQVLGAKSLGMGTSIMCC